MSPCLLAPGRMIRATFIVAGVRVPLLFDPLIRSGRVSELTDPLGQIAGYVIRAVFRGGLSASLKGERNRPRRKWTPCFETFDRSVAAAAQPVPANTLTLESRDRSGLSRSSRRHRQYLRASCQCPSLADSTEKNLPVGLQFVGRAGDDFAVISGRADPSSCITDWHIRNIRRSIRNRSVDLRS